MDGGWSGGVVKERETLLQRVWRSAPLRVCVVGELAPRWRKMVVKLSEGVYLMVDGIQSEDSGVLRRKKSC